MKQEMEDKFFIKLIYYFCSTALCVFLFLLGNIRFDRMFVIIFFLPFSFMFIKRKDIKKNEQIDRFDFASYFAGLFIDFFMSLGISLIVVLIFAFFEWYGAIIIFFNLLIDAFVAKNIFFTRFGLQKYKYAYKKSVGIVLKNSICILFYLISLYLTSFISDVDFLQSPKLLIIAIPFYLAAFVICVISLYKRKFILTDLFKIQRYKLMLE